MWKETGVAWMKKESDLPSYSTLLPCCPDPISVGTKRSTLGTYHDPVASFIFLHPCSFLLIFRLLSFFSNVIYHPPSSTRAVLYRKLNTYPEGVMFLQARLACAVPHGL